MSKDSNPTANKKLQSLQDLRELRLDLARAQHEQARALAEKRQEAVDAEQRKIDDSHATARAQLTNNAVISVDALTRIRHFTLLTLDDLRQAQGSLEQANGELKAAHTELVQKATDVRVVERLRDRRKVVADRDDLRREQQRLDDHAMVRFAYGRRETQD